MPASLSRTIGAMGVSPASKVQANPRQIRTNPRHKTLKPRPSDPPFLDPPTRTSSISHPPPFRQRIPLTQACASDTTTTPDRSPNSQTPRGDRRSGVVRSVAPASKHKASGLDSCDVTSRLTGRGQHSSGGRRRSQDRSHADTGGGGGGPQNRKTLRARKVSRSHPRCGSKVC